MRGARVLVDGGVAVALGALILVHYTQADGSAKLMLNSVPDWISTRSFSFRGVVMADWLGRRLVICGWMSASLRAMPGGQPSTMQPTERQRDYP